MTFTMSFRPRSMPPLQSFALRFWEQCRIYAEDGTVWRPQPTSFRGFSFLMRLLIETGFYNRISPIAMSYEQMGQYALEGLKTSLGGALQANRRWFWEYRETGVALSAAIAHVLNAESFQEVAQRVREYLVAWPAHSIPGLGNSGKSREPDRFGRS